MTQVKTKPISVGDCVVVRDHDFSRLIGLVGLRGTIIEVCEAGHDYRVRLDKMGEAFLPDSAIDKVPAGIS